MVKRQGRNGEREMIHGRARGKTRVGGWEGGSGSICYKRHTQGINLKGCLNFIGKGNLKFSLSK